MTKERTCKAFKCKNTFEAPSKHPHMRYCSEHRTAKSRSHASFKPYRKSCEAEECHKTFIVNRSTKSTVLCPLCRGERDRVRAVESERRRREERKKEREIERQQRLDEGLATAVYEADEFNNNIINPTKFVVDISKDEIEDAKKKFFKKGGKVKKMPPVFVVANKFFSEEDKELFEVNNYVNSIVGELV